MIPLSLYIHIPWCIRKCPYCDFNSHQKSGELPEQNYIDRLLLDLEQDMAKLSKRQPLLSIFIGGGTPSLFSAEAYARLFEGIQRIIPFSGDIEITLEANPGAIEQGRFNDYRAVGINRLSLGIQSFHATHLKRLGRIHDEKQAHNAIESAKNAGFERINLDLMYGLPGQTIAEGLLDLELAISHAPQHLSWYQLTIEPNTVFYKIKPTLPKEKEALALEESGLELLKSAGFERYEISAFCRDNQVSQHNLNYWLFGDYYGIGAGAHGKLSTMHGERIYRTRKHRQPTDYLDGQKNCLIELNEISSADRLFEFMLNTTRLETPIAYELWTHRTGLQQDALLPSLKAAEAQGLIQCNETHWQVTEMGRRFTNNLQMLFLP